MTMTNNRLKSIHDKFVSENAKHKKNSKMIWNRLLYYAGDNFLAMNDEEIQQFYITNVIYDGMEDSTIAGYYYSYKRIVRYLKENGYMKADFRKWKRQTSLFDKPIKEDGKKEESIADKLHEKKSKLKESINSIEQEIKKHKQRIKELKEQCSKSRGELTKLENLQEEIITALFS